MLDIYLCPRFICTRMQAALNVTSYLIPQLKYDLFLKYKTTLLYFRSNMALSEIRIVSFC